MKKQLSAFSFQLLAKCLLPLLFMAAALHGQVIVGNYSVTYVFTAPSGACSQNAKMQMVVGTGVLYSCQHGIWGVVGPGGGGGGGTVTTFSAGNLSPLFTASVATPTTTPALSFSLSSAAANTAFGNFTGAPAAPSYTATNGTGAPVATTGAALVTPALGTPASGLITNLTGTCTACTANAATSATTATAATNLAGGGVGSAPYQSGASTTTFLASPTTTAHTFVYAWQPSGSAIAPTALDLATYLAAPPAIGGTTPAAVGASTFSTTGQSNLYAGALTTASLHFAGDGANAGLYFGGAGLISYTNGTSRLLDLAGSNGFATSNNGGYGISSGNLNTTAPDSYLTRFAAGGFAASTVNGAGNGLGSFKAQKFLSTANCSNAASPAVCAGAAAGSVAIPTGTNPTLVVNTTAVTATSQIILTTDDSVTIASTTCNNTLATLVGGVAITARTAATSFTISFNGVITTNPLCLSYVIIN